MIEIDLGIEHHFSAGVYAKRMCLPAGHYAETHEHAYDHMSILASGDVTVEIDGVQTRYTGGAVINIAAGKKHRIEAKTDSVWFCIHATDETDVEHIDEVLIKGN
jgi:quercetin dioxygenase-like cupin family protein